MAQYKSGQKVVILNPNGTGVEKGTIGTIEGKDENTEGGRPVYRVELPRKGGGWLFTSLHLRRSNG